MNLFDELEKVLGEQAYKAFIELVFLVRSKLMV